MSTPTRRADVPYRLEFSVEVPGTPEQVWDAVATGRGMSAWFLPTRIDEREGGALHISMGEDMGSDGHVTAWEPPRRLVYDEDWAKLMGKDPDELSALTSEFVVEAHSGGTCVVRVTTSGFGTGADWEEEFWDSMGSGWLPYFENLRVYLAHFAGQQAATLEVSVPHAGDVPTVWAALRDALGVGAPGSSIDVRGGATGVVEHVGDDYALLRLTDPVPGMLTASIYSHEEGRATATVRAYLFGADAPARVAQEEPAWQGWLADLPVGAGASAAGA